MRYGIKVSYRDDLPNGVAMVAANRMRDFCRAFGERIARGVPMSLQCFAESCYLQGCEDMALTSIRQETKPTDYQI